MQRGSISLRLPASLSDVPLHTSQLEPSVGTGAFDVDCCACIIVCFVHTYCIGLDVVYERNCSYHMVSSSGSLVLRRCPRMPPGASMTWTHLHAWTSVYVEYNVIHKPPCGGGGKHTASLLGPNGMKSKLRICCETSEWAQVSEEL